MGIDIRYVEHRIYLLRRYKSRCSSPLHRTQIKSFSRHSLLKLPTLLFVSQPHFSKARTIPSPPTYSSCISPSLSPWHSLSQQQQLFPSPYPSTQILPPNSDLNVLSSIACSSRSNLLLPRLLRNSLELHRYDPSCQSPSTSTYKVQGEFRLLINP